MPTWIRFALAALSLTVAFAATGAEPKKLNVLFIAVDDMNSDVGCYGSPLVKTPNIDRLAAKGVRFEHAYCQYPLCSPSRTSLMTGLRPDTTKIYDLKTHFRKTIPDVVTLGQMFQNNGYYSARVGKIYHYGNPGDIGTSGLDDPATWNHFVNPAGRDKTALEKDVINYTPKRGLGSSLSFLSDKQGKDEDHTDGKVATEGIKELEAHKDKPFFIAIGFYKPHCPYISPHKYFDLYSMDQIQLPTEPPDQLKGVPQWALASTKPYPLLGVSVNQAREAKRGYYAAISFVDAQIGRVLDAVDRMGLWENTVVVFWSDHGYHLGEHGCLWQKQSVFEEAARIPLIISAPGQKAAGKGTAALAELVDIYPTLAELCGLKGPANLSGKSLAPQMNDPSQAGKGFALTQVRRGGGGGKAKKAGKIADANATEKQKSKAGPAFVGYSLRTDRYRYTEWDDGKQGVELYDHEKDPQEFTNLAKDSQHAETVKQLSGKLHELIAAKR
jgi:iduronate 2-sulfatase